MGSICLSVWDELAHILSHYERLHDNKIGTENQWFEEAVCESASLFILIKMSERWKENPPYPHWKDFAPSLAAYAVNRSQEIEIPTEEQMPGWLAKNLASLRFDPYQRDLNRIVAAYLFRIFQDSPEHWNTVRFLNLGHPNLTNSFESYLENWYFSVPLEHKPFVKQIADLLSQKRFDRQTCQGVNNSRCIPCFK